MNGLIINLVPTQSAPTTPARGQVERVVIRGIAFFYTHLLIILHPFPFFASWRISTGSSARGVHNKQLLGRRGIGEQPPTRFRRQEAAYGNPASIWLECLGPSDSLHIGILLMY